MDNSSPSEKQIKEFWEWCGFKPVQSIAHNSWMYPNGGKGNLPSIDLNSLFRYAVPKLYKDNYFYECIQWNAGQHKAIINKSTAKWAVTASDVISSDPALALFWAIFKVIKGEKDDRTDMPG